MYYDLGLYYDYYQFTERCVSNELHGLLGPHQCGTSLSGR